LDFGTSVIIEVGVAEASSVGLVVEIGTGGLKIIIITLPYNSFEE